MTHRQAAGLMDGHWADGWLFSQPMTYNMLTSTYTCVTDLYVFRTHALFNQAHFFGEAKTSTYATHSFKHTHTHTT